MKHGLQAFVCLSSKNVSVLSKIQKGIRCLILPSSFQAPRSPLSSGLPFFRQHDAQQSFTTISIFRILSSSVRDQRGAESSSFEGRNFRHKLPPKLASYFALLPHQDVMDSPVVAADGYTYEEGSIRKWLRTSRVSPKTNEDMHSTLLQPNNALRLAIKSWRDEVHAVQSKNW